jgi:23S rRNA pseudouridine2605 synthase
MVKAGLMPVKQVVINLISAKVVVMVKVDHTHAKLLAIGLTLAKQVVAISLKRIMMVLGLMLAELAAMAKADHMLARLLVINHTHVKAAAMVKADHMNAKHLAIDHMPAKAVVIPDKAKKAYGSADTYKDRKDTKSFHDKPDFEERAPGTRTRKARDFSEGTLGKGKFTKKSELKGIQPREVKEYSDDDFRFKTPGSRGKRLDLGKGKEFVSQSKSQSKERITEEALSIGESVRLNRFISNAGVCSRREADELIGAGLVSINGVVATELGTKVKAGDVVRFNGEKLAVEAKVYLVLNKPKDAITTLDDPDGRNTVMDIFEGKMRERVYPIGRLDRNTTGVLLLTNDGELAQRLMHPKYEIKKVYKATLNKNLKPTDLWSLSNGVELEDGFIKPDAIAQSDAKNKNVVGIEIHSGKNRIIHRMFEHLGYTVDKLDRVLYAGMEKGNLKRGEWRELNDKELKALKRSVHLK